MRLLVLLVAESLILLSVLLVPASQARFVALGALVVHAIVAGCIYMAMRYDDAAT